jgi:hypothetical protein
MSNFSKQIEDIKISDYRADIAKSPLLADKWKR